MHVLHTLGDEEHRETAAPSRPTPQAMEDLGLVSPFKEKYRKTALSLGLGAHQERRATWGPRSPTPWLPPQSAATSATRGEEAGVHLAALSSQTLVRAPGERLYFSQGSAS